jgi:hypothetical protein
VAITPQTARRSVRRTVACAVQTAVDPTAHPVQLCQNRHNYHSGADAEGNLATDVSSEGLAPNDDKTGKQRKKCTCQRVDSHIGFLLCVGRRLPALSVVLEEPLTWRGHG